MKRLLLMPLVLFLACEDEKEKDCAGNNNTCQLNFSLEDLNPSSETFGVNIGPQFFNGKVTLYYFPSTET
jgi:hypothetical protein